MAAILDFRSERFFAIFDLQVTLMIPIKFQASWPFGSGEEAKNIFSRWPPWSSWISETIIAIYNLQVTQMLLTKFRVKWHRDVGGIGF